MKKTPKKNEHHWIKSFGEIDIFALEYGYHNGPKCADCGYEFCHHCNPDGYKTECEFKLNEINKVKH